MRIISFIHTTQPLTGGQRYNVHLEQVLSAQSGVQLQCIPEPYERYSWYLKPLSPILELRWLSSIQHQDVILLGDTTYKYHILLQWVCRHILKCRTLIMIHHFAYLSDQGIRRCMTEWIQDHYFSQAHRILVPSPYTKEVATRKFASKVVYLPLPFTISFTPSIHSAAQRLLFVGNIEYRKGLHYLPPILHSLPSDVVLDIVGAVQDKDYYDHLVQSFAQYHVSERVMFHGSLSPSALRNLYEQASVFVFPSLLEGYGIVLIEAMGYGIPIVAFDNSAMPYTLINGKNGFLVPNRDWQQMAQQIQFILKDSSIRMNLQSGMADTLAHLATQKDFQTAVAQLSTSLIAEL